MGFLDDYEPVEDRLAKFWADHPDGAIHTHLRQAIDGFYIVEAKVWRDRVGIELGPDATGLASEKETQRGVNSTSALENCETSAIGRALANLGYAPKGKRPSREEMSKASGVPESAPEHAAAAQTPVVRPPSRPTAAGRTPDESGKGPSGAVDGEAAASAPCRHENLSDLNPVGRTLPVGMKRCEDCGVVMKAPVAV